MYFKYLYFSHSSIPKFDKGAHNQAVAPDITRHLHATLGSKPTLQRQMPLCYLEKVFFIWQNSSEYWHVNY